MMNKIRSYLNQTLITLILITPITAFADVNKLIKNVFPSGTMSNVTKGGIVQEQSAGHLMGGSIVIKTPAESGMQLIHAQAPSCKMGGLPCGAQFELLGGGISMISGDELMQHLKGLVQNAVTYGGMMAIQTLCPQCEDLMEWLDAKADWINSVAKTDCEDMQKLVDGMLPKKAAGDRAVRQSGMVLGGEGRDASEISKKSKKDDGGKAAEHEELKSQLGENYNLVWKALEKKAPSGVGGADLKEMLMSISGTIIGQKNAEGQHVVTHKKSLLNKDLIKDFMGGEKGGSQKVKLYVCDEKIKCLKPTVQEKSVAEGAAMFHRVQDLLNEIVDIVEKNQGHLGGDAETLVSLSSLSLIPKIEIDLATLSSKANVISNQAEFVEALCFDVVTSYLAQLLKEVQDAVGELSFAQIADGDKFKDFDLEARETMRMLSVAKSEAFKRYDIIASTKARLKQDKSYFDKNFEEFMGDHDSK